MRDYLTLGPTPADEPCEQLGENYNPQKARQECRAYRNQLIRQFGEHDKASIRVKSFPHDFGSYLEVVVEWDETEPGALEYALDVEGNLPANWDAEAKAELMQTVSL